MLQNLKLLKWQMQGGGGPHMCIGAVVGRLIFLNSGWQMSQFEYMLHLSITYCRLTCEAIMEFVLRGSFLN